MWSLICARWYLWNIRRNLPGKRKQKQKILEGIRACVLDYVSENPEADYAQIRNRLGDPRQIALSYVAEKEPQELLCDLKIHKRIVMIVSVAAVVGVLIWLGFVAVCYEDVQEDANGYAVVGEAEVIEKIEYD